MGKKQSLEKNEVVHRMKMQLMKLFIKLQRTLFRRTKKQNMNRKDLKKEMSLHSVTYTQSFNVQNVSDLMCLHQSDIFLLIFLQFLCI